MEIIEIKIRRLAKPYPDQYQIDITINIRPISGSIPNQYQTNIRIDHGIEFEASEPDDFR